jgi:hypothetical protein
MRTSLHLSLLIAGSFGALAGCSSDEKECLPGDVTCAAAGAGGSGTGAVGGSGGQTGGGGTGGATGGTGGATGGTGGSGSGLTLGTALTINGATISSTEADISGNFFIVNSPNNAATTARDTADTTKLCVVGSVGIVPGTPPDYTAAYGMEFGFNLNVAAPPAGGGDTDAGADAGAGEAQATPQAWEAGNVTGFSFTIEGPTIPAVLRFKALPFGAPVDPPFCAAITPAIPSGTAGTKAYRFSEITSACYNGAGGLPATPPLQNIAWQVPADPMAAHDYNFCVSNIQPILN